MLRRLGDRLQIVFDLIELVLDGRHFLAHEHELGCVSHCLIYVRLVRNVLQHQSVLCFIRRVHELVQQLNFLMHELQVSDRLLPFTRDFLLVELNPSSIIVLLESGLTFSIQQRQAHESVNSSFCLTCLFFETYFLLFIYIFKISRHRGLSYKSEDILQLSYQSFFLCVLMPQ